jgi:hypothetical protein
MPTWIEQQWSDIKGNVKWDLLKLAGASVVTGAYLLLQKLRHLPLDWLVAGGLFLTSLLSFLWLGRVKKDRLQSVGSQNSDAALPAPVAGLDLEQFLLRSYGSPFQQEGENNILIAAGHHQPNERESFLVKIIARGIINWAYQITWMEIYRSQILLLSELNRKGYLRLEEIQPFYDTAANQWPVDYVNYPIERWISWMKGKTLLLEHPGRVFEITNGGKDFLKFMVHNGFSSDDKKR